MEIILYLLTILISGTGVALAYRLGLSDAARIKRGERLFPSVKKRRKEEVNCETARARAAIGYIDGYNPMRSDEK